MYIATIIVTFNGATWIEKSIQSVLKSSIKTSLIIVDNNSTDATSQIIDKFKGEVILIKNKNNLGFGAANNIALSYALKNGADYVFLLNQDAYIEPYSIEELVNISKQNKEYGLLSPLHLNGSGNKLDFNFSNYIQRNRELQFDAFSLNYSQNIFEVPFVNAAAWLLPRNTLEIVGGFDPIFYHYGEDNNYCQRLKFHKLKVGIVPTTIMFHDREERAKNSVFIFSEQYFKNYEKTLKTNWANINKVSFQNEKKYLKNCTIKSLLKSLVKLNFHRTIGYYRKYMLINNLSVSIEKSRSINVLKGSNYL